MAVDENPFDRWTAAHYEAWYETPEGQRVDALEKAVLVRLLRAFPDARSVLEVGCGTGHFTRWLSERGLAVVGLDLSEAMLAQARLLDGVPLVQGSAVQLPFPTDAFDLVALITTLEFLQYPQEALGEALRVAGRGLLLGVLNRWSWLGLRRRLEGLLRPTVYNQAHFYSVAELERLLRSASGAQVSIVWYTTLFPRWPPCEHARIPWGGFIGMALVKESAP